MILWTEIKNSAIIYTILTVNMLPFVESFRELVMDKQKTFNNMNTSCLSTTISSFVRVIIIVG